MKPKKLPFIVRMNCEYSLLVMAANEDEALEKANKVDVSEWSESWAETEAEEDLHE